MKRKRSILISAEEKDFGVETWLIKSIIQLLYEDIQIAAIILQIGPKGTKNNLSI